jgi:glyoxylate/hydroxypyruvate reductase A
MLYAAMVLLFKSHLDSPEDWSAALKEIAPDLEVRVWPETGPLEEIAYALVWEPGAGELARYPNLKLIASLGAGVDHLLSDPELPAGVPITRMVDAQLTAMMSEYSLLYTLRFHRRVDEYEALQRAHDWTVLAQPLAGERTIGILGLGELGSDLAAKLLPLGFAVAGWSKSAKSIAGVESFHGPDGLAPFLAASQVLVCLLPRTPETAGILNAETLGQLPSGAYLINLARGDHLVEEDLIPLIDSGHLAGAALDVFRTEPLPKSHPFWDHPRIQVTPHAAGIATPWSGAPQVIENIRRVRAGEALINRVDPAKGY